MAAAGQATLRDWNGNRIGRHTEIITAPVIEEDRPALELELGDRVRVTNAKGRTYARLIGMIGEITEIGGFAHISDRFRSIRVELENGERWFFCRGDIEPA